MDYYEGMGSSGFRAASDHRLAERYDLDRILAELAEAFVYIGEHDKGLELTNQAIRMNPHMSEWYRVDIAWVNYLKKDYEAAIDEINRLKADLNWPASVSTGFYGTTKTFQDSTAGQGELILGAILTIYIILGILYESFIHPLTILSGLPAAAAGALGALYLGGFDLSIIAVIGLLMLIGIVKKNAIMMIDVAITLRRSGLSAREAIHKACLMRFRPIMMTTLAALMGTLPIALATGASSELRQPLGIAVTGGLVVSQALTLFITPVLYVYMEGLSNWLTGTSTTKAKTPATSAPVGMQHQPAE